MKKIGIIGGGISGLTLGCVLKGYGKECIIFERSSALSEHGAGLSLTPNACKILNEIDIFLVPLISFNKNLHRVGFGHGFYDKTLSQLLGIANKPKFWGICYDFQLSETNFETEFDVRLDKVISDKKVYV